MSLALRDLVALATLYPAWSWLVKGLNNEPLSIVGEHLPDLRLDVRLLGLLRYFVTASVMVSKAGSLLLICM